MTDLKGKKVLVVGLGASGYAASRLLARKGASVKVTEGADSDDIQDYMDELADFRIKFEIGKHTQGFCEDAELVITSPGVAPSALPLLFAKEKDIPVIGELELGWMFSKAPVIAITGTNGKSTTTELIGKILADSGRHAVVCGNIGNPLSVEAENLTSESVAVVEVSSFQLDTIKDFKPHVAVLLNIAEDHYERHGDYETYKRSKFRIFLNQTEEDWAVLNSSFSGDALLGNIKSRKVFFDKEDIAGKIEHIPLKGEHNLENVACAALVAGIMGISEEDVSKAVASFRALDHRFESIGVYEGIEFIDDSKATNIDATRRALESIAGRAVLIAGGRDKGGDYRSILPLLKEKVSAMVLIGEAQGKMKEAFSGEVSIFTSDSMQEAVEKATLLARDAGVVMLSPMCSSFDMYSSYKERGEDFRSAVLSLRP